MNASPACARRFVAALVVFLAAVLAPLGARAASDTFEVSDQAFVEIRGIKGDITVKTWDRPQVQVDSDDEFTGRKTPVRYGSSDLPFDIPMRAQAVATKNGPVQLPPESFIVSSVRAGVHDGVYIEGSSGAATVTVPASLGVLVIALRGGPSHVTVDGVRNATMIVALRGGSAHFRNVGGDGYVQVLNGRVIAADSSFDRIRVRTVNDNVVFEHCSAKQIEASSVNGSVVYDNGSFVPGQARFESTNGNVLVGIGAGGAQLAAHSGSGRVYSNFGSNRATLQQRDADATATVNGGGPLVNLTSERGNVYLYEGPLTARRESNAWHDGTARVSPPIPEWRTRGQQARPFRRLPSRAERARAAHARAARARTSASSLRRS